MNGPYIAAIVLFAISLFTAYLFWLYNAAVRGRNMTEESWSGIDVQLRRRRDLIPNLVQSITAYAVHERETLEAVTEARVVAEAASAGGARTAVPAENRLTVVAGKLLAVAEQYPDLKASENFMQLQRELSNVESNLAGARQIYNANARAYNDRIQSVPASLFATTVGFRSSPYFEATPVDHVPSAVAF